VVGGRTFAATRPVGFMPTGRLGATVTDPTCDPARTDGGTGPDRGGQLDPTELDAALAAAFEASEAERRVVVRAACDLADDGRAASDRGRPLTVEELIENLRDAPDESLPARWNWWLGALEVAYGGYEPFQIRRYRRDGE
jgi:hypothetical protein